jgi:DNA-binding SARP family transcriptional activator
MQLSSDTIRVFLLGKFEISRAGSVLRARDWKRRKAAALIQRLTYERRLIKDQAIDFLWPENNLTAGSNNLYRTLYALRQTLNAFLGPEAADEMLSFSDGVLRLNDSVWVDAHKFKRLCEPVPHANPEQRIARLEEALALYQGEFLPDERYTEWTQLPREMLMRLRRESSLSLVQHRMEQGNHSAAIELLSSLLASDPTDEPVHRELMRAYTLAGQRHHALSQYQACVKALATGLDVAPDPETKALYDEILSGRLAPPRETSRSDKAIDIRLLAPDNQAPVWSPPPPVNWDSGRASSFSGRQAELEKLSAILQHTRKAQGNTVLIAGETGIGKTHLAMAALNLASESGMTTLMGAAFEQEGRLAFQPFTEALDHFLAQHGRSQSENPISHHPHSGSSDPQQEHWALFKATTNFIVDIAHDSPLVFLVDDLHAADETSLQLFHYLARQTRAAPVVLIATYRVDSPTTTQFDALLSALYREGLSETIALQALTPDAVQAILVEILQGEVSDELCHIVYDITAGNPLFTQEIGWSLRRQKKLERRNGHWLLKPGEQLNTPDNLGALLRQKVARLGQAVQTTMTAAAVLGQEFRFEILRNVTNLASEEILDALDAALAGHLVEETPTGYRFRHPLIRRTLYESLSNVRRANLHTHAGDAIEAAYANRPDELSRQTEALAYHYDLSDRRDRALSYLIQAGENAAGIYAFEVAIDYFERALSLMDNLGEANPALRWRLLESLGWWHGSILADTPKAVACFEQALTLLPTQEWKPASHDIVRLHCGAAVALITAGNMEAAEEHLQTALPQIDEKTDAPEYADLLYNLAQLHWHRNEYHQAMETAQRSLVIAERLDKPDAIARAFEMLALACHSLGEWQEGMAYEQQRAELTGAELDVTDAFDAHL